MKRKITFGIFSVLLLVLPVAAAADFINTTGPTGHYYQYAIFTNSASEFKGGYDVDSYEDLIYVNRSGGNLDVYQVTLLDSDGDGAIEPDQHPQNIGPDELPDTADDQIGAIEERKLTYLRTYSISELSGASIGELYAVADRVYFLGGSSDRGDIYEYVFATGVTSKVVDSPYFNLSQLGYDDVNGVWYASSESSRTVYRWNGTAWVACFTYADLAGSHMDGLEVITDSTGTPYVYVSDMTSDYIGQWRYDSDTGSWKEENLFAYTDATGSVVEGMGFGALEHIWVTGGSFLYELGGGKLSTYLDPASCVQFSVDDGLDLDAGECVPANSTEIVYTVSYDNTCVDIDLENVQASHTDGTWGGTSWNWDIGNVASGATDSTTVTMPLPSSLTPNTTFSNQFTLTSDSMQGSLTATEKTLICPNQPPVAKCKDIQTVLNADGTVTIFASDADNGSSDPDGDPISFSLSKNSFSCSDTGTQHAVTLTVTDDGGLSDSCVANVTVADVTPPAMQTGDVTVQLDNNGNASITADTVNNGTSDACGIASLDVDPSSFTCSDLGSNTVTLTATDVNDNSSSATANVRVEDTLPPSIDANAPATIIPPDAPISFTATVTDNCSATAEITNYSCYGFTGNGKRHSKMQSCVVSASGDTLTVTDSGGVGDNIVWTITAADQSGNTATAEGHVLVKNPGKKR